MNNLANDLSNVIAKNNIANGVREISTINIINNIRKNKKNNQNYKLKTIGTGEIRCWRDDQYLYIDLKGNNFKYMSPWKASSLVEKYKIFQTISSDISIKVINIEDDSSTEVILFIRIQNLFNSAKEEGIKDTININLDYLNYEKNNNFKPCNNIKSQAKIINTLYLLNSLFDIVSSELPSISFYEIAKIQIENPQYRIITFDFFDTVIFRHSDNPKDVFIEAAEIMLKEEMLPAYISPLRFKNYRVNAEVEARKKIENCECNLNEIYEELRHKIPTLDIEYAKKVEHQIELNKAIINIDVINLVQLAIKKNKRVAIISDTYYSENQIAEILGKRYAVLFSKIFTSSDHRTGKANKLHAVAHQWLNEVSSNILHFGDNYISDVNRAQLTGASAILLPNGIEQILEIRERENKLIRSKLKFSTENTSSIFFARQLKVSHHLKMNEAWGHFAYGAYVLGPIYGAYINWAYEEISRQNYDYIFFAMREGYLLNRIFNEFDDKKNLNIKNIYLSRKKLFSASIFDLNEDDLHFVFNTNNNANLASKLSLLNLSKLDFPPNVQMQDDKELQKFLINNEEIRRLIKERSNVVRKKLLRHLFGFEIIKPKINIALLDLGWNTTIQKLLNKCLEIEKIDSYITGYYLMTTITADSYDVPTRSVSFGYLVNAGNPTDFYHILSRNLEILEQCCSPPHGTVIDFGDDGMPVIDSSQLPAKQIIEISHIQDGILKYIKHILIPEVHSEKN